jgi:zinc transport system substrate-binding protein
LTGCTTENSNFNDKTDDKLNIIATIFPPYDFARQIGRDRINLKMLIPPGSESHTYEPSPGDIIDIQNSDIFIYAGGSGDNWVKSIIGSIDSDTRFISLMDVVPPLEEQHSEGMQLTHEHEHTDSCDHSDEGDHKEYDEHIWTSPVNADIISEAICSVMCELDTANSSFYQNNYDEYSKKLTKLDSMARDTVKNAKRDTIIFADRFPIRYFTEEYGIRYFAAFPGCAAEVEPSPKTLMFIIDKVQNDKIPVVFYRELSNMKVAKIVSEDTKAKMLQFHSCHSITKNEFDAGVTYTELMEQNILNLKEALN